MTGNPFALAQRMTDRNYRRAELMQAMQQQQAQAQAQAATERQGFRNDLMRDVVRNATQIANTVGGTPVEAAIASALGSRAATPGYTLHADQTRLDQGGADVVATLAQAMQRMEDVGQMPQIDPDVLLHAGVPGLETVIPQATQRAMLRHTRSGRQSRGGQSRASREQPRERPVEQAAPVAPANAAEQRAPVAPAAPVEQQEVPKTTERENPVPMPGPDVRQTDQFVNTVRSELEKNDLQPVGPAAVGSDGVVRQRIRMTNGREAMAVVTPDGAVTFERLGSPSRGQQTSDGDIAP